MRKVFQITCLPLLILVSLHPAAVGQPFPEGSDINIHVQDTAGPIVIDGRLDDPAWGDAQPYLSHFFQLEPLDRAPSSEPTKLMVLQDGENIYVGAQCFDSEPDKIFASIMRRDGGFLNGDAFEMLLDTFQDKRNSYAFGTNPLGIKVDAIISDEGNHINKNWDCIWRCKTAINDEGWALEMAIPFKSLKYKKGDVVDWGINIAREIKHRNEETYLAPIPRGLGHNGKFKGSLFANLRGIKPPQDRFSFELQPHLTTGRTYIYRPDQFDSKLDAGLDARYYVTPQFTVDLTYKTDFAQVEADEEIINVTRFNINLQEKRGFFLESAGLFTFGSKTSSGGSLVGASRSSDFLLFNSRTIGIKEGRQVPLLGGAKVTGRVGKYSLGFMNIQSERTELDAGAVEPSSNITAVKLKRDLYTNSNVGLMVLNKQNRSGGYSRAVGGDAFFAFSPEFIINGSIAGSYTDQVSSHNLAGDAGVMYNQDWIDVSARYTHIDSLFNPEMGFVRRGNIRKSDGSVGLTKWINNDYLKSIALINQLSYITDHHNVLQTRAGEMELEVTLKSSDKFSAEIEQNYEYLSENAEIREIAIPAGIYQTSAKRLVFSSYRSRPVVMEASYKWGERFDGTSRSASLTNTLKLSNNFNLDLNYSYDRLELVNGSLSANLLAVRGTYSFSPELFAKCYIQWNDADHKFATNLLLDYIYKPRSHIYLVYNENRDTLLSGLKNTKDRLLLLKFTYLWSL